MPDGWEELDGFDDHAWPDYFHMPVLMLMLITLLNDGTLIAIGYDNVLATVTPERWNVKFLFAIGSLLAAVACISSLILLKDLLESWDNGSTMDNLGLGIHNGNL
jgi:H+-transporting ATPase